MEHDTTQEAAERLLITWIGSPNFKSRALQQTVFRNTELGQRILGMDLAHCSTVEFDEFIQYRNTLKAALDRALHIGWLKRSSTHIGRPPINEISHDEITWAIRQNDRIDSTNRRARYVDEGLRNQSVIITITETFIDYLADRHDKLGELDGLTRDEAADKLDIPRSVINKLVRSLRERGWRESKIRSPEGRRVILKKPD